MTGVEKAEKPKTQYIVLLREASGAYRPIAKVGAWSKDTAIREVADQVEGDPGKYRAVSEQSWGDLVTPKPKVIKQWTLEVVEEDDSDVLAADRPAASPRSLGVTVTPAGVTLKIVNCKKCTEPVVWAKTARDKWVLLDAQPTDEGEWYFSDGIAMKAHGPDSIAEGLPRYTCHWDEGCRDERDRRT